MCPLKFVEKYGTHVHFPVNPTVFEMQVAATRTLSNE